MKCANKNIKFIAILTLSLCFLFVLFGCTQKYTLTVTKIDDFALVEKLNKSYAAGEKVTVKIPILTDVDVIVYLDGQSLGKQTAIKNGDNYSHWEYYFVMPNKNAILTFEVVDGFLN